MALSLIVPPASASVVEHADWLELNALLAKDGKSSVQDLVTAIRRSGSTDAVGNLDEEDYCSDVGAEQSMRVAEDAFSEVEQRTIACGHNGAYPFTVHKGFIQRHNNWETYPYSVLLLLTKLGHNAGPPKLKGAKSLENLSAE